MKSNKEFLNGVYAKAETLQSEISKQKNSYKRFYRFASVMALIILMPTLFFLNNNYNYKEIEQVAMIRSISDNPLEYFNEADYIVIGTTKEVGESQYIKDDNYIYTDMRIEIEQVLLGELIEKDIVVRINGGRVKSDKVYSKIETEFKRGKQSLLFINQYNDGIFQLINSDSQFTEVENDLFADKLGQKYSLEDIKNIIKKGGI